MDNAHALGQSAAERLGGAEGPLFTTELRAAS